MWQSPNRGRGYPKSSGNKRGGGRKGKGRFHLKRVPVELKLVSDTPTLGGQASAPTFLARVVLNDINEKGMGLFSKEQFNNGAEIAITFEVPRRIYLKGKIMSCQEFHMERHILSEDEYPYRLTVMFKAATPEEEAAIKQFCNEIAEDQLSQQAA